MRGRPVWLGAAAAFVALAAHAPSGAAATAPLVVRATLDGDINAATAAYVGQTVQRAEAEHADLLVPVMNTPGGISTSMDDMVGSLLNSRVPVAVYVAPGGARADSAGLFVAQAADVVAMAPNTNIGSAHPIAASGGNIGGELEQKVVNDAVARIRDLAASHGRNADWCEQAVRQSVNIGAGQAVSLHVADLQAADPPALLRALDGRSLTRPHAAAVTLHLAGARVEDAAMPWNLQLLNLIVDPNVAYLLLLVAIFGIIGEVTTPGAVLPGTVGVISAILALIAFASLPVNLAGALLILFSFVLFIVDLKAPTHGVLTIGGLVALVLGSALLVDAGPLGAGFGISPWLMAGAAAVSVLLFGFVPGRVVAA